MGSLRQSLHMKTLILLACLLAVAVALPEPRVPMAADPPVLTGLHLRDDADSLLVLMMVDPHRPALTATLQWILKATLSLPLLVPGRKDSAVTGRSFKADVPDVRMEADLSALTLSAELCRMSLTYYLYFHYNKLKIYRIFTMMHWKLNLDFQRKWS